MSLFRRSRPAPAPLLASEAFITRATVTAKVPVGDAHVVFPITFDADGDQPQAQTALLALVAAVKDGLERAGMQPKAVATGTTTAEVLL